MNFMALLIATLVSLPVLGLLAWTWNFTSRIKADLQMFGGFEGMHFEGAQVEALPAAAAGRAQT